jgi:hypothetical protein
MDFKKDTQTFIGKLWTTKKLKNWEN